MSCRSAVTLKILTNTLPYNLDYSRILKKNIIIRSARSGTVYDGMAYRHFSWVGVPIPALISESSHIHCMHYYVLLYPPYRHFFIPHTGNFFSTSTTYTKVYMPRFSKTRKRFLC